MYQRAGKRGAPVPVPEVRAGGPYRGAPCTAGTAGAPLRHLGIKLKCTGRHFLFCHEATSRYTVYLTEAGASRALPTPQRTFLSLQLRLAQNRHARRPWRPQASSAARASSRCSTTTVSRARAAHINGQCKNKTGAGGPSGAIQNLPGTHSKPSHSEHSITLIPWAKSDTARYGVSK